MVEFKYRRQPKIDAEQAAELAHLLSVFDYVGFNSDAEFVAVLTTEFPLIGKVDISLYVRENHLKVYPHDDSSVLTEGYWSGYLHELDHDWEPGKLDRDILIMQVRGAVRDALHKALV